MNELLNSAEFLVHVAVPGAVAQARGGQPAARRRVPSWDVEGGGACVPVSSRLRPPFSRFRARARARVVALVEDYFHSKKHHLSDLMSMSVNAMYE